MNKYTEVFDSTVGMESVGHGFMKIACDRELYVDTMNGELYSEMPEFIQLGDFEITFIGDYLYTRTKRIYGVKAHPSLVRLGKDGLYLALPYDDEPEDEIKERMGVVPERYEVCLLNGDESGVYWLLRVLEDDSIVVMDDDGGYFHVYRDAKTGKAEKERIGSMDDMNGKAKRVTKLERAYELGFNDEVCSFEDKGFYLDIFVKDDAFWFDLLEFMGKENILHSACILANDDKDWYFISSKLDDGSIIILNQDKKYFYVEDGKKKRYIGCEQNEDETQRLLSAVKTLRDKARRKVERLEAEKLKRRLVLLQNVVPFESNGKWGLRLDEKTIVPPIYNNIKEPVDNYCAVETSTGQWGVIRIDGKVVVDTCYQNIDIRKNGTACLTIFSGKKMKVKLG